MRVTHSFPAISTTFDDPNLVSCSGLAPSNVVPEECVSQRDLG